MPRIYAYISCFEFICAYERAYISCGIYESDAHGIASVEAALTHLLKQTHASRFTPGSGSGTRKVLCRGWLRMLQRSLIDLCMAFTADVLVVLGFLGLEAAPDSSVCESFFVIFFA